MLEFLFVLLFVALLVGVNYFEPIRLWFLEKRVKKKLSEKINSLRLEYSKCICFEEGRFGIGFSGNSSITFEKAHVHQEQAMQIVLDILDSLEE